MAVLVSRRHFVGGLVGLIAAPAIVRAASLMPVRSFAMEWPDDMMFTMVTVREKIGNWPYTALSAIYHRRDLADLSEPFRSQVLEAQRWIA